MPAAISFRKWEHLFISGKTKVVYFALLSFTLFALLILESRENLFLFVVIQVGAFASFGVLVDYVSHLLHDGYNSGLTFSEWVEKFKDGRTHDVFGILVQAASALIVAFRFHYSLVLLLLLFPELYFIIKARFYH